MTDESIRISSVVDLTLLDIQASAEQLQALSVEAQQFQVAAICVYPQHLPYLTAPFSIKRAAVVNFPTGEAAISDVLKTVDSLAKSQSVQEIDYVFPYQHYLNKNTDTALFQSEQLIARCRKYGLTCKIILETEAFPSLESIEELCFSLIEQGCNFLKTSTGTKPIGATIEAATVILNCIRFSDQPCGLKVSGGVRTKKQALTYIDLAETMLSRPVDASWFRIGCSQLLRDL
jgi:deoxyribose-phosphate aldolase